MELGYKKLAEGMGIEVGWGKYIFGILETCGRCKRRWTSNILEKDGKADYYLLSLEAREI